MQQIKGWLQSFLSLLIISGACIRVWLPTWLTPAGDMRALHGASAAFGDSVLPTFVCLCQRHQPYGHEMMFVFLQTCTGVSSACLTKPAEKVWAINFLRCLTVGVQNYWQQAVFVPQSRIFQLFQQSAPRKQTALYRRKTQVLQSISHNTFVQTTLSWAS